MNKIPEEIKQAFAYDIEHIGGEIVLLGSRDGTLYFTFRPSEPVCIGFPVVYGYDNGITSVATVYEALALISTFVKDD